jgi:hypothetical protein
MAAAAVQAAAVADEEGWDEDFRRDESEREGAK